MALWTADGIALPPMDDRRVVYLDAMGPNPSLEVTAASGQWSVTNVPASDEAVVVAMYADNGVLVGCELAATSPDALSIVRIRPLRRDAPSVCRRL